MTEADFRACMPVIRIASLLVLNISVKITLSVPLFFHFLLLRLMLKYLMVLSFHYSLENRTISNYNNTYNKIIILAICLCYTFELMFILLLTYFVVCQFLSQLPSSYLKWIISLTFYKRRENDHRRLWTSSIPKKYRCLFFNPSKPVKITKTYESYKIKKNLRSINICFAF